MSLLSSFQLVKYIPLNQLHMSCLLSSHNFLVELKHIFFITDELFIGRSIFCTSIVLYIIIVWFVIEKYIKKQKPQVTFVH